VNDLTERREEVLRSLQDILPEQIAIIDNLRDYASRKGDAYLVGGIDELKRVTQAIQELMSLKVALNGLAVEDAKQKHEGDKAD